MGQETSELGATMPTKSPWDGKAKKEENVNTTDGNRWPDINDMPNEPRCEKTGFLHMRKKDADQLRSNCAADQRLCFRYIDSIHDPSTS